jgi:hypothetical protein
MRLVFASIHAYLDSSDGAALSTRELLELLAARGADCRALTAGVLDYEPETTLDEVLAGLDLPAQRFQASLGHPVVARSPDHPVICHPEQDMHCIARFLPASQSTTQCDACGNDSTGPGFLQERGMDPRKLHHT